MVSAATVRAPPVSRLVLELFADASNVLNAVNYTRYSGVITSPLLGQPLAAQAPGRIDLGMRVGSA